MEIRPLNTIANLLSLEKSTQEFRDGFSKYINPMFDGDKLLGLLENVARNPEMASKEDLLTCKRGLFVLMSEVESQLVDTNIDIVKLRFLLELGNNYRIGECMVDAILSERFGVVYKKGECP